ncbi:MAG: DUF1461 domain-containing protein [Clostridiales bacterium]|nr:DUF1461 domain-containing protein [Clostridiales bacterium]
MKVFKKILAILAAIALLYGCLTIAVNIIFNETGWLYKEYLDDLSFVKTYYGISPEDSERVLSRMMYYSIGRADDLDITIVENGEEVQFFNESELSHMRDVRKLAHTILWSGAASLAFGLIVLAVFIIRKDRGTLRTMAKACLIAFIIALVIVIGLAIWVIVDFDSFWTMFHVVFLDLESSTFDPAESRMIRICPAELFADFTGNLGTYAAVFDGGLAALSVIYLAVTKKKKNDRVQ